MEAVATKAPPTGRRLHRAEATAAVAAAVAARSFGSRRCLLILDVLRHSATRLPPSAKQLRAFGASANAARKPPPPPPPPPPRHATRSSLRFFLRASAASAAAGAAALGLWAAWDPQAVRFELDGLSRSAVITLAAI
ncbi:hypothetical protein HK405_000996, partial [Cladochytrium tenue]